MKQFLVILLFLLSFHNLSTAQSSNYPDVHATEDKVFMYSNSMEGEVWIDDTTSFGMSPFDGMWHYIAMLDTSGNYLWYQTMTDSINVGGGQVPQPGFAIDSRKNIYFASNLEFFNQSMRLNSIGAVQIVGLSNVKEFSSFSFFY